MSLDASTATTGMLGEVALRAVDVVSAVVFDVLLELGVELPVGFEPDDSSPTFIRTVTSSEPDSVLETTVGSVGEEEVVEQLFLRGEAGAFTVTVVLEYEYCKHHHLLVRSTHNEEEIIVVTRRNRQKKKRIPTGW